MKWLILALLSLSLNAWGDTEEDVAEEICEAVTRLSRVTRQMKEQRMIEAASGVKDLKVSRSLGAEFVRYMKDWTVAQKKPEAKNMTDYVELCEGMTEADERRILAEIQRFTKESK